MEKEPIQADVYDLLVRQTKAVEEIAQELHNLSINLGDLVLIVRNK